uniref:Integrase catalytic domain-containing protein n=1 Tax=candidate division WOR-3 bacterium TaxID=2052148 RepID=A0A7C6A8B5_UNCW3
MRNLNFTPQEKDYVFKIAAFIYRAMSKIKFRSVSTEIAIRELERIRVIPKGAISVSRANELMNYFGISQRFFKLPRPCIRMTTVGPNYLHQADFTVSQMFYLHNMQIKFHSEYAKKQPKRKVMMGVLKDHFSQCIFAKAYEMVAESSIGVIQFLYDAWSPKLGPGFPFHGLPWNLYTDAGPGWKSKAARELYKALFISWKPHSPGNARATGSVEKGIDSCITFEKIIKGRLSAGANISLERFNQMLFEYCIDLNNKPHTYFTKLKRFEIWQQIKDEDIRCCPPWEIFLKLTATEDEPRRVTPYGTIKYQGKEYYIGTDFVHQIVYPYLGLEGELYVKIPNYGIVGPLKPGIPFVQFGEYKTPQLTTWEKNIQAVKAIAQELGFSPDDIDYERQSDDVYIPREGRPVIEPESERFFTSIYEVKSYLADSIDFDLLPQDIIAKIDEVIEANTDAKGFIPISIVEKILKIIQPYYSQSSYD